MRPTRVLVLGYIVRGPLGGLAWHHLQYVVGLARMGYDVRFLEVGEEDPTCYDPVRHVTDRDPTYGLAFARRTFERLGLGDRWAYYDARSGTWVGGAASPGGSTELHADVLLNLSAVNRLIEPLDRVPVRVVVDTDPGFLQARHLTDPDAHARARLHNHFFTFAGNVGSPECRLPDDGFPWRPTRQPVVLALWRSDPAGRPAGRFTTLMQWQSYPPVEIDGMLLGMKSDSFAAIADLPGATPEHLEIALGSPSAPRELLRGKGWTVVDPLAVSEDPWTYQAFIQASKGEFSVAKAGYVTNRSGWFSERSCAYLASSRPVVVQDTGFSKWLPVGEAIFPFDDLPGAVGALRQVSEHYGEACKRAREVAGDHFGHSEVLGRMFDSL